MVGLPGVLQLFSVWECYLELITDENLPVPTIKLGHLYGVLGLVTPVNVSADPIHSNSIWVSQCGVMYNLEITFN